MNRTVMAVGAHADDVELHSGGTLLKYRDRGYEVVYVMATNNMSGSRRVVQPDGGWLKSISFDPATTMAYRKREAAEAAKVFGAEPIHLDHPQRHYAGGETGRAGEVRYGCPLPAGVPPDVPTILTAYEDKASVARLADLILERLPEAIFTHGFGETNPEHYCTALLVVKAYRQAAENGFKGNLLAGVRGFPELGRFANCWETWVDIDGYLDRRHDAVVRHVSQYPPDFAYGRQYWREIAERLGKACGAPAVEVFNFVSEPGAPDLADGDLTRELKANRCGSTPWNL